ncbi:MAG: hypothetical protein EOP38_16415 [Rubrivivax sp.]|nr:MAG: hypothetical protein EOP38_16415 [Rubrivivax sp.]
MFKNAVLALVAASSLVAGSAGAEGLRPFIGGGITVGGDNVNTLRYQGGDEATLHAGGLLDLRAGVDYRVWESPMSVQASIAYHTDRSNANNGSADFSRVPVELVLQWHATESWAFGGGLRKATGARYNASGAASSQTVDQKFKSSVGFIIEGEYFFNPSFGLKARYVNEEYTSESNPSAAKLDGSHVGVLAVYYFR